MHDTIIARAVAIAIALAAAGCAGPQATPLVHLEVHGEPSQNGKILDASFDELERTADASSVAVDIRSGGSVSLAFFELHGVCAVAHAHGAAYVFRQKLSATPARDRLTFPKREAMQNGPPTAPPSNLAEPSAARVMPVSLCNVLGY